MRKLLVSISFLSLLTSTAAVADYQPAPKQYSLVNFGAGGTQHVYRDGNKAMVETNVPKSDYQPKAQHLHTLVDVPSRQTITWDQLDKSLDCKSPSTTSDWGDPFNYWNQAVQSAPGKMSETGKETVNGMQTTVYAVTSDQGSAKLWRDDKYGLLIKFVMTPKGHAPVTVYDVRKFKVGKPKASVFAVPSRCSWKK